MAHTQPDQGSTKPVSNNERAGRHAMDNLVGAARKRLDHLRWFDPAKVATEAGERRRQQLVRELPGDIAFMRELLKEAHDA